MGTLIRPEISKNSPYYISRHRYYELLHFCRQYSEYIGERKKLLNDLGPSARDDINKCIKPSNVSDITSSQAIKMFEIDSKIEIIEDCLKKTDDEIKDYLFDAVTKGTPYEVLESRGMPCSKGTFYNRYRKFFWLLDKVKSQI